MSLSNILEPNSFNLFANTVTTNEPIFGADGPQGPMGTSATPPGNTGSTGPIGYTGSIGYTGATGMQGQNGSLYSYPSLVVIGQTFNCPVQSLPMEGTIPTAITNYSTTIVNQFTSWNSSTGVAVVPSSGVYMCTIQGTFAAATPLNGFPSLGALACNINGTSTYLNSVVIPAATGYLGYISGQLVQYIPAGNTISFAAFQSSASSTLALSNIIISIVSINQA